MRLPVTSIVVVLSMGLLAPASYADLSSSTYARAKDEYEKGVCRKAQPLLKKYKKEDDSFLKGNPTVLSAINDAIDLLRHELRHEHFRQQKWGYAYRRTPYFYR